MILIDWLWMFFQFWASLVVVAVVEINGKRKIFGWHWFLIYFANFWAYFIILATAHFDFLRIPGNSNSIRIIFFPGENPENCTQTGSLLEFFPTFRSSPYFFHIWLSPSKKFSLAIAGMSGKYLVFIGFWTILVNFWVYLVINY